MVVPMSADEVREDAERLAELAKAISHPARVVILAFLRSRTECVAQDVVDQLPLAQSTVSEHLRILRDAGLVNARPSGTSMLYCVDDEGLEALKTLVSDL